VRIDLLLIFCLDNEDNLDGYQIVWIVSVWKDKLGRSIDRELRGVLQENELQGTIYKLAQNQTHFENVCHGILVINLFLHDAVLVHSNRGQKI
jgi:hypothetical protein